MLEKRRNIYMSDIKKGKKKRFSHIFTPSSAHVKGKEQRKKNNKLTNLIVFHINDDSNSLLPSSNH